jgi:general secretion pathway protein E
MLSNNWMNDLDAKSDDFASKMSDRLIRHAIQAQASDLHLDTQPDRLIVNIRIKGLLSTLTVIPLGQTSQVIARFKALAGLLTYRTDMPQEGRIALPNRTDARVCSMPTMHGERLAIRFSVSQVHQWHLNELGLGPSLILRIANAIEAPSGVIIVCGPAGAGKTTSAYAMMYSLAQAKTEMRRCLVSLEDPIEQVVDGVSQSQVNAHVGYDWKLGLKTILRQDPEVMLIGEIRDAETAKIVFEAASTGQLVVTTMHARTACDAIVRLKDMAVPVHQMLASLRLLISQRLLRSNHHPNQSHATEPGLNGGPIRERHSRERLLIAEMLPVLDGALCEAIQSTAGPLILEQLAVSSGMLPLRQQAEERLQSNQIDSDTFYRHFGNGGRDS